jgi:hypothetical protein
LFESRERSKALQDALDRVRDKLGEASVVPAGSLAYRRSMGHIAFGTGHVKDADRRRGPDARGTSPGDDSGYGNGPDPSAPDPTQLKPRLPRDE